MGTPGHVGDRAFSADETAITNALEMKAQDGMIAPELPASFSQGNPFYCPSQNAQKGVQVNHGARDTTM